MFIDLSLQMVPLLTMNAVQSSTCGGKALKVNFNHYENSTKLIVVQSSGSGSSLL